MLFLWRFMQKTNDLIFMRRLHKYGLVITLAANAQFLLLWACPKLGLLVSTK